MGAAAPRTAVIGVGNEFRHDDGVALSVVARLEARAADRPLPGTEFAVCDGDPGRMITLWENADLAVVVDASQESPGPGTQPGRVHRLELDRWELGQPATARTHSTHGLGLADAVEIARTLGRLPGHLVVYTVELADISLGTGLSGPVAAAVEPLVERIEVDLAHHRDAAARGASSSPGGEPAP
jgi:hydrogenase maturation protease